MNSEQIEQAAKQRKHTESEQSAKQQKHTESEHFLICKIYQGLRVSLNRDVMPQIPVLE